nr:putative transporter [Quercus suber]
MFNSLQGWFFPRRTAGVLNGEPDIDEQTDVVYPSERDHDGKVQQHPISIDPVIQTRVSDDLHLDVGDRYSWLLTIFYIPYIIFELSIVGWKIFPPHIWLAFLVFGWGAVAACQAATTTWAGMMVCRFLLAAFEAGFGPGTTYFLSFFYLRTEIGFRQGIFLSAAPLATCFAGALAYGITSGHAAIANWRLLFLVEGLPVVFPMAVVSFFFCPDSAHQAWFLSEEEKRVALARGVRQTGSPARLGGINLKDTLDTLKDAKPWFTALMYFSCNVSFASLPVYLPTILQELGFSGVAAQGLSAPPYFLAFLVTILTSWLADRTQQRGLTIMIMSIIGGAGYIMLATTTSVGARYAGAFLAASGVFPCIANILPWVTNNQGSDTRRGIGIIMLNVVGQCGPLLGTRLYPGNEQPRYIKGQSVCAAFMFFTTLLAFSLRTLLAWENRKLDKKYGTLEAQRERADTESSSDVAMENYGPMYRYVL